jgi:phage terminase small subunit
MSRGAPKKPRDLRVFEGNPSRRPLPKEPKMTGRPKKPQGLCPAGRKLWDDVSRLARVYLKEIDTASLRQMCEIWGLYRQSLAAAKKDPIDKENRIAVLGYSSEFQRLAARFGLTPCDRAKIQVEETVGDDLERFIEGA